VPRNRETSSGNPDFAKHAAVLRQHLASGFADDEDAVVLSKACRVIREGLRMTSLSVGRDADLTFEEKGLLLSSIALVEQGISGAYDLLNMEGIQAAELPFKPLKSQR
jgi:hypothetical protein